MVNMYFIPSFDYISNNMPSTDLPFVAKQLQLLIQHVRLIEVDVTHVRFCLDNLVFSSIYMC